MNPLLFLPGPSMVPDEVLREMSRPLIGHRSRDFHKLYASTTQALQKIFKTESPVYVLTASGTGGVEAAVANLVAPGDRVLVPIYGEFSSRLSDITSIYTSNVVVENFQVPEERSLISFIESHSDADMLMLVYNDTSPGLTLRRLDRILRVARNEGILTLVDAVSVLGGEVFDMDSWGIDAAVAASQKCLASPPGFSFVSLGREAMEKTKSVPRRPYYLDLLKYAKYAERNETPFTPAVNLIYALERSLRIILEDVGLDEWIKLHAERAKTLYEALRLLGLKAAMPLSIRSNTVISVKTPRGCQPTAVVDALSRKYSIYIAYGMGEWRDKILRIGNMGAVHRIDLYALVAALADIVSGFNVKIDLGKALEIVRESNLLITEA